MSLSGTQWFKTLETLGVIKKHEHQILFSRDRLYENPVVLDRICGVLGSELEKNDAHLNTIDRVVGHFESVQLAHSLARLDGARKAIPRLCAYAQKDPIVGFKLSASLKDTERTLLCVDVFNSVRDVVNLEAVVEEAGGIVLPYLATLWNVNGVDSVGDLQVISILNSLDNIVHI